MFNNSTYNAQVLATSAMNAYSSVSSVSSATRSHLQQTKSTPTASSLLHQHSMLSHPIAATSPVTAYLPVNVVNAPNETMIHSGLMPSPIIAASVNVSSREAIPMESPGSTMDYYYGHHPMEPMQYQSNASSSSNLGLPSSTVARVTLGPVPDCIPTMQPLIPMQYPSNCPTRQFPLANDMAMHASNSPLIISPPSWVWPYEWYDWWYPTQPIPSVMTSFYPATSQYSCVQPMSSQQAMDNNQSGSEPQSAVITSTNCKKRNNENEEQESSTPTAVISPVCAEGDSAPTLVTDTMPKANGLSWTDSPTVTEHSRNVNIHISNGNRKILKT